MVFKRSYSNHLLCLFCLGLFLGCTGNKDLNKEKKPGFYTYGRFIYTPDGEKVVLRGVNKMNVITDLSGEKSFPEIAKTGANVVRIMWMEMGGYGEKLDVILSNCLKHDMIPLLELHDATGKWEKLDQVVEFWLRPDVIAVIKKYEKYLLLNIANEAGDGSVSQEAFRQKYAEIIKKMRSAGIKVPLVIDAANWGRNEQYLLNNASYLLSQDPDHNLIFSWHIWDSGIAKERIKSVIDQSIALEIPFSIGEFAPMEVRCKCCIPYQYILEYCQQKQIGWMAWSWGPGNGDCPEMDMTENGDFETLHDWGLEVALIHPYSIKNTSVRPAFLRKKKAGK